MNNISALVKVSFSIRKINIVKANILIDIKNCFLCFYVNIVVTAGAGKIAWR